ncbi:helix-turn-helix domain-containing protein [Mesorhizobium sp. ORM6]
MRRLEAWDIGSLRIFCTVVETGSFWAAARVLNLAATTISKHISGLEDALERPLRRGGLRFRDRRCSLLWKSVNHGRSRLAQR